MQSCAKAVVLLALALVSYYAMAQQLSPSALSELAPTGKLRIGIHYANEFLVSKNPEGGRTARRGDRSRTDGRNPLLEAEA